MLIEIRGYLDYKYNTDLDVVVSYKNALPRNLKWYISSEQKTITLCHNGRKRRVTRDQLETLLLKPAALKQQEPVSTKGFIVASIDKIRNTYSMADTPKVHGYQESAKAEAERLAKMAPSKKYAVLELKGVVSVSDIKWE